MRTEHGWEDLPEIVWHQFFDQDVDYYDGMVGGSNDQYTILMWDEVWDTEVPSEERRYHNAERVYLLQDQAGKRSWILESNTSHNFYGEDNEKV